MVIIQILREKLKILDVSYGTGTGKLCNVTLCQIQNPRIFFFILQFIQYNSNNVS